MKKAVLVVGLPASGKTTFIENNFDKCAWLVIDDPKDYESDVEAKIKKTHANNVVIADPYLCFDEVLPLAVSKLEGLGFKVEVMYFENNPEKCLRNMHYRNMNSVKQRKVGQFIVDATGEYFIPDGVIPLVIWDGSLHES